MKPSTHPNNRRPIPESYWVIPGQLLAGEYPGARNELLARRKVQRLLHAGITCFFDLTETGEHNLPPYQPLLAAASSQPISYQRYPIPDMGVPTYTEMSAILQNVHAALVQHIVYLHCWGGIGRTGLVVACYLVQQGFAPAAALEHLATLRHGTPDSRLPAPATSEQRAFVFGWQNHL